MPASKTINRNKYSAKNTQSCVRGYQTREPHRAHSSTSGSQAVLFPFLPMSPFCMMGGSEGTVITVTPPFILRWNTVKNCQPGKNGFNRIIIQVKNYPEVCGPEVPKDPGEPTSRAGNNQSF